MCSLIFGEHIRNCVYGWKRNSLNFSLPNGVKKKKKMSLSSCGKKRNLQSRDQEFFCLFCLWRPFQREVMHSLCIRMYFASQEWSRETGILILITGVTDFFFLVCVMFKLTHTNC